MPCLYKGVIRVSQQDRPLPDIRDYDDDEEVVPDATDTYIFDVEVSFVIILSLMLLWL